VPKAGNHWFKTYYVHYIKQLYIKQLTYDSCLLQSNNPFSIVGLQTDNTLFLADKTFAKVKQIKLNKAKFMAKKQEQLIVKTLLKFNKGLIYFIIDKITFT
jgi:hypothetical protein